VSRDLLIVLLVLGLLANVALIAGVAWLNHRAATRPPTGPTHDPGAPVVADDTDPARFLGLDAGPAVPGSVDTPAEVTGGPPAVRELADAEEPATLPAARRTPRAGARSPAETPTEGTSGRRRFVMPDDRGSHVRTERATAAFLREPVVPDAEHRSGRRRHRARRPAGKPVPRTDFVISLAGPAPDPRIVHGLSGALRGAVRTSDKVIELPNGRLRITLETDIQGGEAFVRRARGVVRPWLTALDPDVELRVERPRTPARPASGTP
jgi:hypothetical protein